MGTAEKSPADLDAVSDHPAFAVLANRRNGLNCALKAIESVTGSGGYQFETLVVLVSTNLAGGHTNLLLIALCSRCPHSALFKMSSRPRSLSSSRNFNAVVLVWREMFRDIEGAMVRQMVVPICGELLHSHRRK